ncbi:hypothetical protein PRZ61_06625 [Halomonas pacifica]|nr:hypothetical protein [Halomonas pacifica]MDC8803115.1 hypothetical protein [Halomonas pacifica]
MASQRRQLDGGGIDLVDQQALGQLQGQSSRRGPMACQGGRHAIDEMRVLELLHIDIDRQAQSAQLWTA